MSLATLPVEQILKVPFPSFHTPFGLAHRLTRSAEMEDRNRAIALLEGLRISYPQVLMVGQELVLALMETRQYDQAEQVLNQLENDFKSLDEETLCRWGRLFKDRGDPYIQSSGPDPDGAAADLALAVEFYGRSREKYEQAYRIRSGHYPGINLATLLLILGSLPLRSGAAPGPAAHEWEDLAEKLLANRPRWPRDQKDDLSVWHPATAGEAHLLRKEWNDAAGQYREALKSRALTHHARDTMRRQAARILTCFRNLGVTVPAPFDNSDEFFDAGSDPVSPPNPASSSPVPASPS